MRGRGQRLASTLTTKLILTANSPSQGLHQSRHYLKSLSFPMKGKIKKKGIATKIDLTSVSNSAWKVGGCRESQIKINDEIAILNRSKQVDKEWE